MSAALDLARLNYRAVQLGQRIAPLTGEDVVALDAAQHRADAVLGLWGVATTAPVPGERPQEYRQRMLAAVQEHAPKFAGRPFGHIPALMMDTVEERVYADAATAALDPSTVPAGRMRVIRERDGAGRLVTKWIGQDYMAGIWDSFTRPGAAGLINRHMAEKSQ
ncbi:MAG TPA: hypothetical protein VND19_18710 [Acetobacteraceae bacterium]|nr:hypothetical protein [Acetobacteraceae bacterium]